MKTLILAALLSVPVVASAAKFEIASGVTQFGTIDGLWNQRGSPDNRVADYSRSFSFGITGNLYSSSRYGVDWHLDYTYFGSASSSCHCTVFDSDYDANNHVVTGNGPKAHFSGSGTAQGVSATIEPYYWVYGKRLGFEVGAMAYHGSWTERVNDWSNGGPVQNFTLASNFWRVVPVVGVSISKDNWRVSYKYYFTSKGTRAPDVPPLWSNIQVLELSVKF